MCVNLRYRERQLGAMPVIGFFLNRPFWCPNHHFKPKKRDYFLHRSLIVKHSAWSDPKSLDKSFDETAAFSWLQSNAMQFGFELSYPPSNLFGFEYEPWHWCYQRSLA